jgi:AcrR family transcriptional regulator
MSKGDETRTRILRAAVEILGRDGPDRLTASALAQEAGVSKATVFHHFDALDDIPVLAFEEIFLAGMERVDGDGHSLEAYLNGLSREVHAILDDELLIRAYFVFLVKGIFEPRLRERLAHSGLELHDALTASLAPRLPPGGGDPAVTARLVEVVLDGLALHQLVMGDHDVLDQAWSLFVDGLTHHGKGAETR